MKSKEEYLLALSDCVVNMEEEEVVLISKEYLENNYDAFDGIMNGLVHGMERAGDLYDKEEYFITDLLLCSDAMYAGLEILKPHMKLEDTNAKKHVAVIGVIEGDTHDIGKNLVKIMLETAGFEMHDLGRDVPIEDFINKAKETNASLICISTLMTTTMPGMIRVVDRLKEENMKEKVKVLVGGGPVSKQFADKIGADAYSSNAIDAVKVAKQLVQNY